MASLPVVPFPRRGSSPWIYSVAVLSRLFLKYGNKLEVNGLDDFLRILDRRRDGSDSRGLLTGTDINLFHDDSLSLYN
jgi:hypothetical protein